jgi:hypothetical protein
MYIYLHTYVYLYICMYIYMYEYTDSADWWMHVAGCAGSHVVIRCHDDQLPEVSICVDIGLFNSTFSEFFLIPYIYVNIYVYVYICLYICTFVYISGSHVVIRCHNDQLPEVYM